MTDKPYVPEDMKHAETWWEVRWSPPGTAKTEVEVFDETNCPRPAANLPIYNWLETSATLFAKQKALELFNTTVKVVKCERFEGKPDTYTREGVMGI